MIQITEVTVGDGAEAKDGDKVTMHYRGSFPDGREFDSSYKSGRPFSFRVGRGEVIKGFDMGVLGLKVGGKRKIDIPSELGYGARGAGGVIPPNQDLVFEIELVSISS
jgi:FKBP-type peptidyl-prolyl cis-trans isomerase FkpA